MVLKMHSDASYLNKSHACCSYSGYFFCDDNQHDSEQLNLNGAVLINASILKLVAASAAEAELGAVLQIANLSKNSKCHSMIRDDLKQLQTLSVTTQQLMVLLIPRYNANAHVQ